MTPNGVSDAKERDGENSECWALGREPWGVQGIGAKTTVAEGGRGGRAACC